MDEAARIFNELVSVGLQPDVFTYNTFVSCYACAGKFTDAMNVIKHMKKSGCRPSEVTYHALVDAYCKLGKFPEIDRVLRFIKNTDPGLDRAFYRRIASRATEFELKS
jgi:pentatricopeptide repeat domain-containing protein 1